MPLGGFRTRRARADTDSVLGLRLLQGFVFVLVVISGTGWSIANAVPLRPSSWHGPGVPASFVPSQTTVRAAVPSLIGYLIPRNPAAIPQHRPPTVEQMVDAWHGYEPPPPVPAIEAAVSYDEPKRPIADVLVLPRPPVAMVVLGGLELHDDPLSPYRFDIDEEARVVTVTVEGDSGVAFEIDYRDGPNDAHRTGIAPVFDGLRFESQLEKHRGERTYPLVTPTLDAGRVTETFITNEDGRVFVRYVTGPYTNLVSGDADDGNTYLDAVLTIEDGVVAMELDGLYYIRPSAHGTSYSVRGRNGAEGAVVDEDTAPFTRYIADPKRIDVEDGAFGYYRIRTDAAWLQVQWPGYGSAFEFDFDHTYKDKQQLSVLTRIVFAPVVDDKGSADPEDA